MEGDHGRDLENEVYPIILVDPSLKHTYGKAWCDAREDKICYWLVETYIRYRVDHNILIVDSWPHVTRITNKEL